MITQDQRDDIFNIIGFQYTPKIVDFLDSNGIKNNKNQSFKPPSIRRIVSGIDSNALVELYIQKCIDFWKQKITT